MLSVFARGNEPPVRYSERVRLISSFRQRLPLDPDAWTATG